MQGPPCRNPSHYNLPKNFHPTIYAYFFGLNYMFGKKSTNHLKAVVKFKENINLVVIFYSPLELCSVNEVVGLNAQFLIRKRYIYHCVLGIYFADLKLCIV